MRKPSDRTNPAQSAGNLLKRLRWTVLRPLAARLGGEERSLFRGPGVAFDELREYQPGDDVRLIDWNTTARAGTPFIRQSRVQRALDVWILLDLSASIDWGTARCLKRDRALEFISAIGSVFDHGHHHVGALFFAERPLGMVAPAAGQSHLLRLLSAIQAAPRQDARGRTDLHAALTRLERVARRRAVVIIVSDFLLKDGWQPALGRLAQQHELIAVRLTDPREMDLPDVGILTLEDPETGRQLVVDTRDRRLRERFHQAAVQQSQAIQGYFRSRGVDFLELNTSDALLPALIRFLENRQRRARQLQRGNNARQAARAAAGSEPL